MAQIYILTALAGATASLRSPIGPIIADPELRDFFRTLMDEAFAVGRARGIALDPAFLDERMNFVVNEIEPDRKASMAYDLERGKRLELDWLTVVFVRSDARLAFQRRRVMLFT